MLFLLSNLQNKILYKTNLSTSLSLVIFNWNIKNLDNLEFNYQELINFYESFNTVFSNYKETSLKKTANKKDDLYSIKCKDINYLYLLKIFSIFLIDINYNLYKEKDIN